MVKQHKSGSTKALLSELERKHGFSVSEKSRRGTIKLVPPKEIEGPPYFTHGTESSYHQLKRDIAKLYKIKVSS